MKKNVFCLFVFLNYLFIYLFMAVLGLRFCARAFSSCGKQGTLFIAVRGPLTVAASLVAEHSLQTRRLSNCGSQAQLLRGMWDPPRPGLEPMFPAWQADSQPLRHQGSPKKSVFKKKLGGTSLVVQWLTICLPTQGDSGSISGRGTKVPYAVGQLSPCATTREKPTCRNEEPARRNERSHMPQLRPDTAKQINKY